MIAPMDSSAVISSCGLFRYTLTREWECLDPRVLWICLNPSRATADVDDPTVRKVIGFSGRMGAGSAEIVNLYAYRATDPRDLIRAGRPVGPDNDAHIRAAISRASVIICAWGEREHRDSMRAPAIRKMLDDAGRSALCLGRAKNGQPRHPLMLAYATPTEHYHGSEK